MLDLIRDYLQTQGLRLNADEVRVAQLAAEAVMDKGVAVVEREVLYPSGLGDCVPENEANTALLKQLFMAVDALFSRAPLQTAVLYALPAEGGALVRVVQFGEPVETRLQVDEAAAWSSLAVRAAHSGWLNQADDVAHWLACGELQGEHNCRSGSQTAIPVTAASGQVFGVLHLEHGAALDDAQLAEWIGLALALLPKLQALFPKDLTEAEV